MHSFKVYSTMSKLHSLNNTFYLIFPTYKLILRVISDSKRIFSMKCSEIEFALSFSNSFRKMCTSKRRRNNRRLNFQDSRANRIGRSYCDWICWHPCRTNDCRKVDQTVPQGWVDFVLVCSYCGTRLFLSNAVTI